MADTEIPAVSVDTLPGCIFPHLHKYFILFYLVDPWPVKP